MKNSDAIKLIIILALLIWLVAIKAIVHAAIIFIGVAAHYAKERVKQPIKGIYIGIEWGVIIGILLSILLSLYMLLFKADPFGLILIVIIFPITIIGGGIIGFFYGARNLDKPKIQE